MAVSAADLGHAPMAPHTVMMQTLPISLDIVHDLF